MLIILQYIHNVGEDSLCAGELSWIKSKYDVRVRIASPTLVASLRGPIILQAHYYGIPLP